MPFLNFKALTAFGALPKGFCATPDLRLSTVSRCPCRIIHTNGIAQRSPAFSIPISFVLCHIDFVLSTVAI